MKFLHLSDLHIGKKVNDISMIEEQKNALLQALNIIDKNKIDFVVVAGDVFDKPIPPISALEVFSDFLVEIEKRNKKIFIISGNHDNLERLSYLSVLLKKNNIYFSSNFNGKLEKFELENNVDIYLLPYLYPAIIRKFYPKAKINNYTDAIKTVIENTNLNKEKFNILVAHQFVSNLKDECIHSDSEEKSVGGVDMVSSSVLEDFDYVALGHLHCPQKVETEKIRYGGSLLKYSFSEINQNKFFTIVEINNKNKFSLSFEKINFLHEMKEYVGFIDEFLNKDFYSKIKTDDYIHFTLKDEEVIDAKKKLSSIYSNIMLLDFDNIFTRNTNLIFNLKNTKNKTILEHFEDFYKLQSEEEIDENKKKILTKLINSKGETSCDQ